MRRTTLLPLPFLVLATLSVLPAQPPWAELIPYESASGGVRNTGPAVAPVWTETITVPGATFLQVHFQTADLGSDEDRIVVSSVQDAEIQSLDRLRLKQWRNRTAVFNGPSVVVTLHLAPGSRGEVAIGHVLAGAPVIALPEGICGSDDRVLSSDARVCRLVSSATSSSPGCTGWVINSRSTILSAGHCATPLPGVMVIAEFNVPLSNANGTVNHPPVADQYPVDEDSIEFSDNGVGDDWAVARLHPNSLGETAFDNQGAFTLATSMPVFVPGFGPTARVTGYGIDSTPSAARNGVQQTATGGMVAVTFDILSYSVDTDNGNSGGPIILESSGQALGIHTNGGCESSGFNTGTSILKSSLQTAIADVSGCASITLANGVSQSFTCANTIFDFAPDDTRWNVAGVSSTSDWDLSLDGTNSAAGGDTCDFALANGHLGSLPPRSGSMFRFSGSTSARGQWSVAEDLTVGQPLVSAWSSSRILRMYEFNVTAAGNFDVTVSGDPSLRWRLYAPGNSAAWRPRSSSTLEASGTVNGPTVSGVSLGTGFHCIVVSRDGNAATPSPSTLILQVCTSAPTVVALPANGNPVTITAGCQPFTLAPTAGRWNVVGLSSTSDWDTAIGPAFENQTGALNAFVLANGHDGAIAPVSGNFTRASGTTSAVAQHVVATTMNLNNPTQSSLAAGRVVSAFEFTITTTNAIDVAVTGGGGDQNLKWRLFEPTGSSAWQERSGFDLGSNAGSAVQTDFAVSAGTYCLVVMRDGGAAGSALPFTVHVATHNGPATFSPGGFGQTLALSENTCVLSPTAGRWNAFGMRDAFGEWNVHVGPAESLQPVGNCDFVVTNGHLGSITPVSGFVSHEAQSGAPAAQMPAITSLPFATTVSGVLSGANVNDVLALLEFEVTLAGDHVITVGGNSTLEWAVFAPGADAAWRPRAAAAASGDVGAPAFTFNAGLGWHAIVIAREDANGTIGGRSWNVRVDPPNPLPVLISNSPGLVTAGSPGFTLTCTGSGFVPASVIRWNGADLATTPGSATSLTASVPAALVAQAGIASVTVFSPAPGGGTSAARSVTVGNPIPALTSLFPASANAGSGAFTLALNGSGFNSQSWPRWNGTALAVLSATSAQIQASVPASLLVSAGAAAVTVFNPAPGGGTSLTLTFTITNPAPVLASIAPASATAGSGPLTLTLTGSGINTQTVARWNGTPLAPAASGTATQLVATVPAALLANAGTASVTLFNPAPGGGTSAARTFTINNPAPALLSVAPASIAAGGAAFTLTLTGLGFTGQSVPRFGGTALVVSVQTSTLIQAAVPAALIATAANVPVTVFNPAPGGGTSPARTFVVEAPVPAIASVNPASLVAGGPATTILVNGSGFVADSVVRWNGAARTTTFVGATQISAAIPATDLAAAGAAQVTVFNHAPAGGTSAPAAVNVVPPAILFLNPASIAVQAPGAGPVALTVSGVNFLPGISRVSANGVMLVPSVSTASQLTVQIDPAAVLQAGRPGAIAINVENAPLAPSNTVPLVVGSGANDGTIRRAPLAPQPGQAYAALLEGGAPSELLTIVVDLDNPPPVAPWPDASANLVLAITSGNVLPLLDGIGLFGAPQGVTYDAAGRLLLPGFVAPNPPLGIRLTLQSVYLDPTATLGFNLSWARFPDTL